MTIPQAVRKPMLWREWTVFTIESTK
jgi:hypothetical protein